MLPSSVPAPSAGKLRKSKPAYPIDDDRRAGALPRSSVVFPPYPSLLIRLLYDYASAILLQLLPSLRAAGAGARTRPCHPLPEL